MKYIVLTIWLFSSLAWAAPLSPAARAVIPADSRQVISIDYHMLRNFASAMALKAQVLPDNLKQFESALKNVGVNLDSDLETLTFASFDDHDQKHLPDMVAVASGNFSLMGIVTQLQLQKLSPSKYHGYDLYPVSKALAMTFLARDTILMGEVASIKSALDFREGHTPTIDTNKDLNGAMRPIEKATVWSVLDRVGTQRLLLSVLGDDAKLAKLASVQERIMSSYFRMNFRGGIRFEMNVLTSDGNTSSELASLLKMGILYKKVIGNPAQKVALDKVIVTSNPSAADSDRSDLTMLFKADDRELQGLLDSQCFAGMTTERKEFSGFTSAVVRDDPKGTDHNSDNPDSRKN